MYAALNRSISSATERSKPALWGLAAATACMLSATCTLHGALPEGLAAYYRFNAASGLTAVDETGAHDGTLTGQLQWVEGVDGNALQFRGGNGSPFVNLGAWQTNGPAGLSLALWVRWAGPNSLYQGLISQRQGTMYWWSELSTDSAQLRFKSNTSPQSNLYLTTPHMIRDEWVHVAFSHDAAAGRGVIYLNGEERLSGTWALPTGNFANLNSGIGVVNTADGLGTFNGAIDEAMIFQVPLSAADVKAAMRGYSDPVAADPNPANGLDDVPVDVNLSWASGELAVAHDVYLGASLNDVAAADRTDSRGVLVSQGRTEPAYSPDSPLDYGRTYYWRVDEVNAVPDSTIFKGETWSFTTEPFAYPISGITAVASSYATNMGPEKTVDGSGLTGDLHSREGETMWLSSPTGPQPTWIQFEFDKTYKLDEMWVWNSNQVVESYVGFGCKSVTLEYSTDGITWIPLAGGPEFTQATGMDGYVHNTTVDFGGVEAKYVKLTINSNFGMLKQYGLSEVRFFYVPVLARAPQPADGATEVNVDAALNWRPGREATSHDVYFGTDPNAVATGAVPAETVTAHGYEPGSLDFGTTYHWRVDEVGEAGAYPGELWSFTTQEYRIAEDFESYTDDEGSRIYETWIDGWTNGSGSVVGYLQAPFAEKIIVHGGAQSMPLEYNNVNSPYYSEAERTWSTAQDWTTNGADTLSLYFRGNPADFFQRADGTMVMGAGGADIWGNADQFRFAYKSLTGDGSIVARVDSMVAAHAWTKVGVMIRESLEAGSKHVSVVVTPDNGVSFLNRPVANAGSVQVNQTALAAPYWVKLTRAGNTFTAQRSADGITWTDITSDPAASTVTVSMLSSVYIGLAVTSHNTNMQTSARFSNVATTGNVTGQWQQQAIGAVQPSNSPALLYVTVEDKAGHKQTVTHTDPEVVTALSWQQWRVPLSEFRSAGVNVAAVKKLLIGVGDRADPKPGGAGILYIDDIGVGHPVR